MELKYPRAIRGSTRDVIRIGSSGDGTETVFLIDPSVFPDVLDWGLLIHDLTKHIAIAVADGGVSKADGTPVSQHGVMALLAQVFNREQERENMGFDAVNLSSEKIFND